MKNEKGQIVLILVLVMTVALAIGISVIQRSLSDISTASKVEQSSRAFSAAEAGIEKALNGYPDGIRSGTFDNQATAEVKDQGLAPCRPGSVDCAQGANAQQIALEYPLLAKEEVAHVWLANPDDLAFPYTRSSLDIYWGNADAAGSDRPAIEITVIYQYTSIYQDTSNEYKSKKYFLDPDAVTRGNNFDSTGLTCPSEAIETILSSPKAFFCKKTIDVSPTALSGLSKLVLLRARLLYNTASQPFAVHSTGNGSGGSGDYLPPQARIIKSTGISGQAQRTVQLFQIEKVVPSYFDYAIFSSGEINK